MCKAEDLKDWMEEVNPNDIDDILEFLLDCGMLNDKGSKLRDEFWEKYIKEE